jgi:hypothetical protein
VQRLAGGVVTDPQRKTWRDKEVRGWSVSGWDKTRQTEITHRLLHTHHADRETGDCFECIVAKSAVDSLP